MAISDRQAAAITRRKRQARFDREQADERARVGNLMGFEDQRDREPDVVGWNQASGATLKGTGHLCLGCQPERPLGFQPVFHYRLAARSACTRCGVVLETLHRPGVTGGEKKG